MKLLPKQITTVIIVTQTQISCGIADHTLAVSFQNSCSHTVTPLDCICNTIWERYVFLYSNCCNLAIEFLKNSTKIDN